MAYAFRIVNVFTIDGDRFSGNPLAVFDDARGLDDRTMQARQASPRGRADAAGAGAERERPACAA